jgi:serine phosphatase RsbU (regulator of sigma subunit)
MLVDAIWLLRISIKFIYSPARFARDRVMRNYPIIIMLLAALIFSLNGCGASERDTFLTLEGEWKIMRGNSPHYARPELDDSSWPEMHLPSKKLMPRDTANLNRYFPSSEHSRLDGHVWFRKQFNLDQVPSRELSLVIGEIMIADRVFLNGEEIGTSGRFPPDYRSAWSLLRSYPVPRELLKEGENVLAIHVYYNAESWIMGPIEIMNRGAANQMKLAHDFFKIYLMQSLSMMLFAIAVFFIIFFIQRKNELEYLYFSITAICLADMIALQFTDNLYHFFIFPSDWVLKITQVGLVMISPFLALFFRYYNNRPIRPLLHVLYLLPPLIVAFILMTADSRSEVLLWRNRFLLIIPLYMADVFYVSIRSLIQGRRTGLIIFLGVLPTLVLGVHDILAFALNIIDSSIALYVYGIPLLLLIIAIHMISRFVSSLNEAERLNKILRQTMEEGKRLASLEKELEIARDIQLSSIPANLPDHPGFQIAIKYVPAEKIGGDFYNFHEINGNHIGVLICDVSGHGVPAALLSSMVKALFITLKEIALQPANFLIRMNEILTGTIGNNFLTAGYLLLDYETMTAYYARGGHEPLLVINRDGEMKSYIPRGRLIGVTDETNIEQESFTFHRGDRFVLYTDCAIEAMDKNNRMFGERALLETLFQSVSEPPSRVVELIYSELMAWTDDRVRMHDDLTLVVIDVLDTVDQSHPDSVPGKP